MPASRIRPSSLLRGIVVATCLCVTMSTEISAQTSTWTTTDGLWSVGANWGGIAPVGGDTTALVIPFNGQTASITLTQDLADPFILNSLLVTTTTLNVTLNGGGLYFQGAAPALSVNTTGTTLFRVNSDVFFDDGMMLTATGGAGAIIHIGGNLSTSSSGAATLTLGGSSVNGSNRVGGIISDGVNGGTLSVFKTDAGHWTLTNAGNSFTGGLTIEQGYLRYTSQNALGDAAGSITLGTAANLTASLSYTGGGAHAFDRTIGIIGTTMRTIGSETTGGLTFNGTLTFLDSDSKSIVLSAGSTTAQNDFQSLLVDNGAATTALTKTGLGLWIVSNTANYFTGGVTIESGILRAPDVAAINLPNNNLVFAATPNSTTGGVLETSGSLTNSIGTGPGQVRWLGTAGGGFSAYGGDLHVTLNNDADTPIQFGGSSSSTRLSTTNELQLNSPSADSVTYIHNSFLLTSGTTAASGLRRINVDNNAATLTDWAVITGTITGSGGIFKTGEGKLVLTAANDFTGGVTLHSGTLEVADPQVNLNLANQALRFSGTNNGLSGSLQTSGSLNFAGLGTGAGQVSWLTNGSGGFAAVGGSLAVTITTDTVTPLVWGATPDFLSAANNEIVLSSTSADNVVTWFNSVDLGGAARQIRVLENASSISDYAVIAGDLSNGGITKTGGGMLVLSGNNTFSGGITIGSDIVRGVDPAVNLNILDQVNGNNVTFRGTAAQRSLLETSGSLTNAVGAGNGQIQWAPISSTGASGGFSAFGGSLDVTLNNDSSAPLVWHSTAGFVRNSGELQFNTVYSDNVVTFNNPIDLNDAVRTIRVNDNTDSAADYAVMNGVISSATPNLGGLIVQGTGTLVLAADNTYTLTTTVASGSTLQLGHGGASGSVAGAINVLGTSRLVFDYSTLHDMSTNIVGSGGLVVNSQATGIVVFSTAKTFTGATTIQNGTLQYGVADALPIASRVAIDAAGVLDLGGFSSGITTLSDGDGGGGAVTNSGAGATLTLTQGFFSGSFQGATLGLIKSGVTNTVTGFGVLALSGSSSFSGDSTLYQGTIIVGNDHALGAATWNITGSLGFLQSDGQLRTLPNALNLIGNATISGSSDITFAGKITNNLGSRTLTINNTGVTTLKDVDLTESATARSLTLWAADDAHLVIGAMNAPTNNGALTITGTSTGSPGATVLFDQQVVNTRTITFGGVGRSITIADGLDFKPTGAGLFYFVGSDHSFTVGAGASIGAMGLRVAAPNTLINVLGSLGSTTITLTGAGSKVSIASGGSMGNGAITLNNDTTYELQAGATAGNGTITTLGSATVILNGTKGTGNGTLDTGAILTGSGVSSGTWSMAVGSNIYVGGEGHAGTLTLGRLVLNGGTLRYELGAQSDLLVSSVTPSISGPATINVADSGGFGVGNYTLMSGYSGTISNIDRFNVVVPAGYKKLLVSNAGSLVLEIAAAVTKSWDGAINNVWDDGVTANFSGAPFVGADQDAVVFADGASNTSITISTGGIGVTPSSVLVDNSATTYTFAGDPISGDGLFIKQGDGLLVLLNDNTSTGAVQIRGGAVQLGDGGTTGSFDPNAIISLNNNATLVVDRSDTLTLTGNIGGTGGVVMNGTGTLQLAGFNSYFGGTTVNSGTLEIVDRGIINEFGGVTLNEGTLNIVSSTNQSIDALNVNGGTANLNLSAGNFTITTVNVNGGTLNALAGNMSTSNINVAGGTLNLNGPTTSASVLFNLESGTVNVNSSILTLSVSRFGGANGSSAVLNIGTGLTLSIWNTLTFTAAGDGSYDSDGAIIQGDGVISFSGTRTLLVHDSVNAEHDLTILSTIAAGGFVKTGGGTLYLPGVNLSSSGVGLTGTGAVVIGNDLALGGGIVTVTAGTILGDGTPHTLDNVFRLRGSSTISGTSALTFAEFQTINSVTLTVDNTAKTTITNFVASDASDRTQTIRGTGEIDFMLISTGAGVATVNFDSLEGTGVYNLYGANSYGGITSIRSGQVRVYNDAAFGSSSKIALGVATAATRTAALLLDGGLTLTNDLHVINTVTSGYPITIGALNAGTATYSGNITLSQNVNLYAPASGTAVFSGNLLQGGTGASGITVTGGGTVLISGDNAYAGATVVEQGVLQLGSSTALGTASALQIATGAVIDLNGFHHTVSTLTDGTGGGGTVTSGAGPATLTVGDGYFSGTLDGGGGLSLVKDTLGTLELAGNNNFTGATLVNAGTLLVSGTLASTNVTVASGAALGGDGGSLAGSIDVADGGFLSGSLTVAGTVTSSGIISAGASTGPLTMNQLVLDGGNLNFELDAIAGSGQIVVTGGSAPTVNAATTLNLTALTDFDEGVYGLISGYTGATIDGGQFAALSAPTTLSGLQVALTNADGALNLVVSTTHLTWNAAATNAWNSTDVNWVDDGSLAASPFSSMSVVTFSSALSASNDVVVDAGGVAPHHVIVDVDAATTFTFSGGDVIGTSLAKNGDGSLILAGNNTYARGVTINAGELAVGDGGTSGDLVGDVVNNALLSFNRSDVYAFAGDISGTGGVVQNGGGTLILTGDNSYTGLTTINAGTLEVHGNFASNIVNGGPTTAVVNSFSTDAVTFTSSMSGNLEFQQNGAGITTLAGNNTYTGATVVNAGTLVIANEVNGSQTVTVNFNGNLTVTSGASLTTPGGVTVAGTAPVGDGANLAGVLVNNGTINAAAVIVGEGGVLKGTGAFTGDVVVNSGGGLSPGNSVGIETMANLTLSGGAVLTFEFRDVAGGAGVGWDLIQLNTGLLDLGDASAGDPITINIDAWAIDNSGHDAGAGLNNFDPLSSYQWLFIHSMNGTLPEFDDPPDDDLSRRFVIDDAVAGAGVFGDGNAFTRPSGSLGRGTFGVVFGDLGQGSGLYITYSAIPEPGSMILAGLASLGAGWYGRRRMRRRDEKSNPIDTTLSAKEGSVP